MTDLSKLPHIEPAKLHERRERVFLVLAGVFLGSLAMLNILGITRFIKFYEMVFNKDSSDQWSVVFAVAVGVLPYPITFLCTDLISEFFGRRRANFVVFVGLLLNVWVVFILWLGGVLPGFEQIDPQTGKFVLDAAGNAPLYYQIQALAFTAVGASMVAYLAAQFCDVYVFHFWKRLTKGKHLWLRNNGSTMVSQMIDTVAVILLTHYCTAKGLPMTEGTSVAFQLIVGYILAGYVFKVAAALLDTIPIYIAVHYLGPYLRIDPTREHIGGVEESR